MRKLPSRIDREISWKQLAKGTDEVRDERRWTPVHIDFHVDDFEDFLAKAVNAGAKCGKNSKVHARLSHSPVRQWFVIGITT
jgi:hypothetical protein